MNIGRRQESDEELIEKYIERPKRRLRISALTLALSKGVVLDELENDALEEIKADSNIERLILALSRTDETAAATKAWNDFFAECFNTADYRLAFEVRRFVRKRQNASKTPVGDAAINPADIYPVIDGAMSSASPPGYTAVISRVMELGSR